MVAEAIIMPLGPEGGSPSVQGPECDLPQLSIGVLQAYTA